MHLGFKETEDIIGNEGDEDFKSVVWIFWKLKFQKNGIKHLLLNKHIHVHLVTFSGFRTKYV